MADDLKQGAGSREAEHRWLSFPQATDEPAVLRSAQRYGATKRPYRPLPAASGLLDLC